MSYHVYFSFSTGLTGPIKAPKGTLERITRWIQQTETICGLTRTPTYTPEGEPQRPGWHWDRTGEAMHATAGPKADHSTPQWWLADRERDARIERMSDTIRSHNDQVRALYADLGTWQARAKWKRGEAETITPAQAQTFWGGLTLLELPRDLWTRDHFVAHMEHLYTLLTTGASRDVTLDCPPFDPKQTEALIGLFESELDQWGFDCRFSIPLDADLEPYDRITTSDDGGYDWCSRCGPINSDDFRARCRVCPHAKKGECDLKNSHPAEFEDENDEDENE